MAKNIFEDEPTCESVEVIKCSSYDYRDGGDTVYRKTRFHASPEESVFKCEIGDIVIDSQTDEEWVVENFYQIGNYGYCKISKDGVIRKLSDLTTPLSTRDAYRYYKKEN